MVPRARCGGYARSVVVVAGVDLSWSGRYPTGLCALDFATNSAAVSCETLDADGVAAWLGALGPNVVAGVDAPLIATSVRRAEAEMARTYGSRGVYAYSARPEFLASRGIAEGPRLGTLLSSAGWNLDPQASASRTALEVFPHAILVALLGAPRILRYKRGRLAARLVELAELRRLLSAYAREVLPRRMVVGLEPDLDTPLLACPARAMKGIEDRLDAIACAFAAHHAWRHGLGSDEVFGNVLDGYIAVPKRR